ncbi:MAG: ABC transporter ATP-binding protein [Solirubrobacteraceae bacterium]|nr:ABC transporter ATP-binding protein [Solirubrobacteraceae bacterium]
MTVPVPPAPAAPAPSAAVDRPPAIVVDGISKTFRIPTEQAHTLKERALHPFRRSKVRQMRSLRHVSFHVEPGEFFGVVGRNGSGKSTMLKTLAGIYGVDDGRIFVNGRMSTFIELGVGFNPDLAAFDNVMLNAQMLGLGRAEARRRFDAILEFAELQDFADLKIKNYSSGMLVRLAFAVMIQVDAEILLIDEVLAVGDAAFQQKCFDEFERIRESGATVILVTHDMTAVKRFCDRALLLERGTVVAIGDPEEIGDRYLDMNFSSDARQEVAAEIAADTDDAEDAPALGGPAPGTIIDDTDRHGSGRAEIVDSWVEDGSGRRVEHLPFGSPCTLAMRVTFHDTIEDPLFGISVLTDQGVTVFEPNNLDLPPMGRFAAGETREVRIAFASYLAPGRYHLTPALCRDEAALEWFDRRPKMHSLLVTGTVKTLGTMHPPFTLTVDEATDDATTGPAA